MYTDTKNLAAINNIVACQQTAPTDTSGREKSCGRMSKMWKPIMRLLTRKRTTQPRKFHPNNVDLNNTTQYQVMTKEDSANIQKQQDICTEFIAKQMTNAETRLAAYQQQTTTTAAAEGVTTTPLISSVYVDKATTTPTAISSATTAITCTGCIYGRNCQQVHSASEQEQLNLLNLLSQSDAELSLAAQLQFLSTDHGLLCFPDDDSGNSAEHDQLLYALLYQRLGFDAALPGGTLC